MGIMKLLLGLVGSGYALTAAERSKFKCRSGTFYQYDKVDTSGGESYTGRASANNGYNGCYYEGPSTCYRKQLDCEVSMTEVTQSSSIPRLEILSNGIPDHNAWALTGQ